MQRIRIKKALVISIKENLIISRESKEITNRYSEIISKAKALQKRHDEFMALGGTCTLKTYSDNVARQIAEFKQKRLLQYC